VAAASARYDGHADWYDETFAPFEEDAEWLEQLLGPGNGRPCLDVGCGTGRYAERLTGMGYHVYGIDLSADQLRIAKARARRIALGDARHLPIRAESVDTVVSLYLHTDVENFAEVVAEITRCVRSGGRVVCFGLHPCFIGPFVDRSNEHEDDALRFVPGYGAKGWAHQGSGGGVGLWARVGGHHKTLSEFLDAFTHAGLHLERLIELPGGGAIIPRNIAVVATKH
jgi:ubiquinone/menaquinone biosynthesis C-methylase UbiE